MNSHIARIRPLGQEAIQRRTDQRAEKFRWCLVALAEDRTLSLRDIADTLSDAGISSPTGKRWHQSMVRSYLIRLGEYRPRYLDSNDGRGRPA